MHRPAGGAARARHRPPARLAGARRRVAKGEPYTRVFSLQRRSRGALSFMDRIRRMGRAWSITSLAVLSLLLAACNTTPKDETAGMSVDKLYAEAKEEAGAGNYERAGKLYERLEGRAAGTLLSQQA